MDRRESLPRTRTWSVIVYIHLITFHVSSISTTSAAAVASSPSEIISGNIQAFTALLVQEKQQISSNLTTGTDGDNWINSNSILTLFVLYAIVIFGGIFANATLVISICAQKSGRLRKPLLFALCVADLLVVGVSAPLSIILLTLAYDPWPIQSIGCKAIYYLRSMPVAASTICLLMLSLDRYATVKHPRLSQLGGQRRYLPSILAIGAWIGACIICIPILLAYKTVSNTSTTTTQSSSTSTTSVLLDDEGNDFSSISIISCKPFYGSTEIHIGFVLLHTLLVFILPGFGVLMNHLGVRKKLCALSLTARAAHGELPLPMPILRRPTHMIIVTGMANAARAAGVESSDDEGGDRSFTSTRLRQVPRTPRSIRRAQQAKSAMGKLKMEKPAGDLPLPQTSTLRSRRRLANILVFSALIFAALWAPHVICLLCFELGATHICTKSVTEFSLLLGYAHSAISPILYWTLNHNSLRQSCCSTPCTRFVSAQRVFRSHLRFRTPPPPPSSTNEAALGAFNPRFIKARPQNNYRPPASSHYLY